MKKLLAAVALSVTAVACGQSAVGAPKAPPPAKASEAAVSQVVSAMSGDLRACYEAGLRLNPMLQGGFVAEVKIGTAGSVESIDTQDVEGLNRTVIGCMTRRMQSARFPAPGEKGATVRVPVRFKA
jgi:hypothetical protein